MTAMHAKDRGKEAKQTPAATLLRAKPSGQDGTAF